ncbi:hypothetical protein DVW87_17470 [Sphingomonas aracearum]|uniref:Uncharacterized protein n=1 Tax=Sphingomonas aracearum TaxID=2283317 RepID=A0A369VP93_9SPHN|nr:hypothetical protein DVW87_17470 [Sphingomonas aracearum]
MRVPVVFSTGRGVRMTLLRSASRVACERVDRMLKTGRSKEESCPVEQRQRHAHQRQCRPGIVVLDIAFGRAVIRDGGRSMDIRSAILFRDRSELGMRHKVAPNLLVGAGPIPASTPVLFREPMPRHERDILTDRDAIISQDSHDPKHVIAVVDTHPLLPFQRLQNRLVA